MGAELITVEGELSTPPFPFANLLIRLVQEKPNRHAERLFNLIDVKDQVGHSAEESDHRRDDESCRNFQIIQQTQDFYRFSVESDLLFGFAQCRRRSIGIAAIDGPARERDLSLMMLDALRSFCQEKAKPIVFQHKWNEDCGALQSGICGADPHRCV